MEGNFLEYYMHNVLSYSLRLDEPSDFDSKHGYIDVNLMLYIDGIHFLPIYSPWRVDILELLAHQLAEGRMEILFHHQSGQPLAIETQLTSKSFDWLKPTNSVMSAIHASYCITSNVLYSFEKTQYFDTLYKLYTELEQLEKKLGTPIRITGYTNGNQTKHWKEFLSQKSTQAYCSDLSQKIVNQLGIEAIHIHFSPKIVYEIPLRQITPLLQLNLADNPSFWEVLQQEDRFTAHLKSIPWTDLDRYSWPVPDDGPLLAFTETQWQNAPLTFVKKAK